MSQKSKITNKKPSLSYIVVQPTIDQLYEKFLKTLQNDKNQHCAQHLVSIISACYNSKENQFYLCRNLKMPFTPGPISINDIPSDMNFTQLVLLMEHIKKVKQYYFCWVIYFNQDLGLWSVKFMKFYQIQEYWQYFDVKRNLIGIYVGKTINQSDSHRQSKEQHEACKTYDDFNMRKQKSYAISKKQKNKNNFTFDSAYFQNKNPQETKTKSYLKKQNVKQKSISMKQSQFRKDYKYSNPSLTNTISSTVVSAKNTNSSKFIIQTKTKKAKSTAFFNEQKESLIIHKDQFDKPNMNFKKSKNVNITYQDKSQCVQKFYLGRTLKKNNQENMLTQKGVKSISRQRANSPNSVLQSKALQHHEPMSLAKFLKGKSIKKLKISK